jgi:hypothetical protein
MKNMRRLTFTIALLSLALSGWATEVSSTSGNLAGNVSDHSITSLTVSGTMDARDFRFIADSLKSLTSLDLTNVNIEAYENSDEPVFGTFASYPAQTIPATAFFGKQYTQVVLPTALKAVGYAAFTGCDKLTAITFPANVDSVGAFSFDGTGITQVDIPAGLTAIGEGAFSRCPALAAVTIAATGSPVTIGRSAFLGDTTLSSLNLGANIVTIGAQAFSGCKALKTPVLAANPAIETIGEGAFINSGVTTFDMENCSSLKTVGMWAFANTPITKVQLPNSVESLGNGAFFYDTSLNEIKLPDEITTIGEFLLAGSNKVAKDSILSKENTSIGRYAFYNWDQMATFLIPNSVTYIGTKAMAGMTGLTSVSARPRTVPELGDSVWAGVDQPNTILFVYCKNVVDYKTAAQWKEFKVQYDPTQGVNEVSDDEASVKAYFTSTTLVVKATKNISEVRIIDPNGILLNAVKPNADTAEIETMNYSGHFYVVTVTLEGGMKKAFKLLRK